MHDDTHVADTIRAKIVKDAQKPSKECYKVLSSDGLFKYGRIYATGEIIQLDSKTAKGFLALGEIQETNNESRLKRSNLSK